MRMRRTDLIPAAIARELGIVTDWRKLHPDTRTFYRRMAASARKAFDLDGAISELRQHCGATCDDCDCDQCHLDTALRLLGDPDRIRRVRVS